MRKGITLSHLSDMIHKKLNTMGQDIEHEFHPHASEMRNTTKLCIIVLLSKKDELCTRPSSVTKSYQPLFDNEFYQLVEFISEDLDKHGYLSFFHYLGLLTALSFHYARCIEEKKNQTVDLSDLSNWEDPTFDMAVMSLFFIAGVFFKKALDEHSEMFEKNDVFIHEMIQYVYYHIKKLK